MSFKILVIFLFGTLVIGQTKYEDINRQISMGNFNAATNLLYEKINSAIVSEKEVYELKFQIERLQRIRMDFRQSAEDVLAYVRQYFPNADENDLRRWRNDGTLEYKNIDGEIKYFNRSHTNLFRVNAEAKKQKEQILGSRTNSLETFLDEYLPDVVDEMSAAGSKLAKPINVRIKYTLSVNANEVPEGEIIRCWMLFPGHQRQSNIELLSTNYKNYIIANNSSFQRTIYLEGFAQKNKPTIFNVEFKYTSCNEKYRLEPEDVTTYNKHSIIYKHFTAERAPHIKFSDKIKNLSKEIVGDETNPYLIAKKIFTWIAVNIPWAGAREYSTIDNISGYCVDKMYGDCGIKSLLFITLCRLNGIPAKWQSGWMLHPGSLNLHDWTEIYFEGIGWVPVDPDFGLINDDDEKLKFYYFGGIDAYRLIVNDDYSKPLFPAKIHPRSETVDFQRGEVEWKGGNLYFDKWNYQMDVEFSENN